MGNNLFDRIHEEEIHKFNPLVAEGLAYHHVKDSAGYLNEVFKCAQVDFPPGFRYLGHAKSTPNEEMKQSIFGQQNSIDISHSDLYMEKFMFSWSGIDTNGETIDLPAKYLYLPILRRGGMITLRDSTSVVSPVIVDNALSVSVDSIYMPMNKAKLTFKQITYPFNANNDRRIAYVVYSSIYRGKDSGPTLRSAKMITSCAHYLFAKFGVFETFSNYAGCDIQIAEEFDVKDYPRDEWYICESTKLKPREYKQVNYMPSPIKLAIRVQDFNLTTEGMIAAFFYIADHFPARLRMGLMEWDSPSSWLIILGLILRPSTDNEPQILKHMQTHIASLDNYIDGMVREWLAEEKIYVNDIYHFLYMMIDRFSVLLTQGSRTLTTLYGKKLTVMRYVLMDIVKAIFNMTFDLQAASKKGLNETIVKNIMSAHLKPTVIFALSKSHDEVSSVSSPGDCMIPKITNIAKLQDKMTGTNSKQGPKKLDSSSYLDASIAEVGSLTYNPKGDPTGRSRLNPHLQLDPDSYIRRQEDLIDVIDRTQQIVKR